MTVQRRHKASGHYLAGAPLQPTSTATSVRVRDGKRTVTDGPFAETREQLGGYYLVEAKDLDEAIASRCPDSRCPCRDHRSASGDADAGAGRRPDHLAAVQGNGRRFRVGRPFSVRESSRDSPSYVPCMHLPAATRLTT